MLLKYLPLCYNHLQYSVQLHAIQICNLGGVGEQNLSPQNVLSGIRIILGWLILRTWEKL